ncbi:hypothetical protein NHJ13734_009889 [Beauveria thailandica]
MPNPIRTKNTASPLGSAAGRPALPYYLQNFNITHRDIKPDNILINSLEPLEVKLTDFSLSKMIDSDQTFLRTFCGTLLYCPPEVYTEYLEYDDKPLAGEAIAAPTRPAIQPCGCHLVSGRRITI